MEVAHFIFFRDGIDGSWSSFGILVGTPPQNLRVFPSTTSSSIWVVEPGGCIHGDPTYCADSRGSEFNITNSLTWRPQGEFELLAPVESQLGLSSVAAQYGLDTVSLAWQGQGGPSLTDQLVAGFTAKDFYLGVLPLNSQPINTTDQNHPIPSVLGTLKNKTQVPSLSWAYTAGAPYRPKEPFGSLTFGGYDSTRFVRNDVTFHFGPDLTRDLTFGIQAITSGSEALLPHSIITFIDSNMPYIWLPIEACNRFESVFGITWNSDHSLYLVNDTMHENLISQNFNITFTLGSSISGGPTVDIVLPYASFDLKITLQGNGTTSRYFPLKRAQNHTQYVLGRTFLQEAYGKKSIQCILS
jgi:hypothetical protein